MCEVHIRHPILCHFCYGNAFSFTIKSNCEFDSLKYSLESTLSTFTIYHYPKIRSVRPNRLHILRLLEYLTKSAAVGQTDIDFGQNVSSF